MTRQLAKKTWSYENSIDVSDEMAPMVKAAKLSFLDPKSYTDVRPIFCDHCASTAIAELDQEVLCISCLYSTANADNSAPKKMTRIRPLDLSKHLRYSKG